MSDPCIITLEDGVTPITAENGTPLTGEDCQGPAPSIRQRIYATASSSYQPAFRAGLSFLAPGGQLFVVGDSIRRPIFARSGAVGVILIVDLSSLMGRTGLITAVRFELLETGGLDDSPRLRVFGVPAIINAIGRQGVQQTLGNLVPSGEYVAVVTAQTDRTMHTIIAPFTAAAP